MKTRAYLLASLATLFVLPHFACASVLSRPANNLGLVGYWAFNEGSGSQAGDSSGQGRGGTLTGSPAWVSGKYGTALNFTSISHYVTTGYTIPAQNSGTSFTWSAWVKLGASGGTQVILGHRTGSAWVKLTPSSFEYNTGSVIANAIPTGQWVQIIIVKDGSSFTYYQNGVSVGTATNAGSISAQTFYIGSDPGFNDGTPNYLVDDVRVYNRALGPSDISALYKSGGAKAGAFNRNGIVGYWNFNDGQGSTAKDFIAGSPNATLFGSPSWVAGKQGKAVSLNGSSQYAEVPLTVNYRQITVSAWFKPSSISVSNSRIVANEHTDNNFKGFQLMFNNGGASGFFDVGNGSTEGRATWTQQLSTGTWYHYVGVYDGTHVYAYLNGSQVASAVYSGGAISPSSFNISIGRNHATDYTGDYFAGTIDDVRIYNRALSAAEVASMYADNIPVGTVQVNTNTVTGGALTNGLVGYWSFSGKDMASNVKDGSGAGNDGDLINYPSTTTAETVGKVGQALTFNGVNNFVWGTSPVEPSSAVTIAAWVKLAGYVPWASMVDRYGGENLDCFSLGFDSGVGSNLMFMTNGTAENNWNAIVGNSAVPLGVWTHVAVSSDGSNATFYINGVADGTASSVPVCNSGPLVLGANFAGGDEFLSGALDEVRLYNRALSAAEIKQLYNAGK